MKDKFERMEKLTKEMHPKHVSIVDHQMNDSEIPF